MIHARHEPLAVESHEGVTTTRETIKKGLVTKPPKRNWKKPEA